MTNTKICQYFLLYENSGFNCREILFQKYYSKIVDLNIINCKDLFYFVINCEIIIFVKSFSWQPKLLSIILLDISDLKYCISKLYICIVIGTSLCHCHLIMCNIYYPNKNSCDRFNTIVLSSSVVSECDVQKGIFVIKDVLFIT